MSGGRTPRGSLTRAVVGLTTAVAALAVLLTGLVTWQSAAHGAEQREREQLTRQATVLSRVPDLSPLLFDGAQVLGGPNGEEFAVLTPDGRVAGVATPALDTASRAALLAGRPVSTTGVLAGQEVLLVGRPSLRGGAVVLTEPYSVVERNTGRIRRSTVLPLVVGMVGAALAGALLARRTARPLVAAAHVAHRLAGGERGVRATVDGPREAAEIIHALDVLDAALARSESRQRDFLLSVSHELRTPLTALQGYAEALADGLIEPGRIPEVGRILADETQRLDRFLGDLLDLARLEAEDFRLDTGRTDLAALVAEAAAFWAGPGAGHGVCLRVEPAAGPEPAGPPPVVDTDAFRVRQLIDGLVRNALRVTPAGGDLVLAVRPAAGGGAHLQVRDSGPGLTDDDVRVAFDAGALYERYRATRPVGSGLGLAIAHRLSGLLGGTIGVEGHGPEGGAAFTVTLPPTAGRADRAGQAL
ncbi:two-component sensor histidine kinase [Kitasatospora herbaricolor]|uniref:sensor histidine kinase n=1 Tax=Kitasatospora herbaricolor TaxID=68217 RepID=UPI0017492799|nr:HAMP domain-containing sensor histidine kinase [Kitasatospora herbaricolor]MDQ0313283.1 two-component system sensor histidine kinase BaeS [Kitasatospora herbaricolor]GGV20030.1 two-component sensor histidine kinase [Kitasatospora herbaricolor]